MRALLLAATATLAAAVLPATAAQALDPAASNKAGVTVHRGLGFDNHRRPDFPWVDGSNRGRRVHGEVDMVTYGGEWALYNNRSWESDSYNDWWHDQPSRSYPRWMSNNQNCERMWWSGGGWRC